MVTGGVATTYIVNVFTAPIYINYSGIGGIKPTQPTTIPYPSQPVISQFLRGGFKSVVTGGAATISTVNALLHLQTSTKQVLEE